MKDYRFRRTFVFLASAVLFLADSCVDPATPFANEYTPNIRLNQIGYYPTAVKKATVLQGEGKEEFKIVDKYKMEVIHTGKLSQPHDWDLAGETARVADFSSIKDAGTYMILVEGLGYSYPFEIRNSVLDSTFLGSIKGLYYQRMGIALREEHAGQWQRPMAHSDDSVLYHPSSGRTKGSLSSPGGWYDAGDYNKYVVNGSFPLGQLFLLEEQYPGIIEDKELVIPESGNGISDYLDELRYEMDWLLTMQDTDGGLFHKLTTKNFEPMVMPHEATGQRYIVGKGTAATLDFSACAAQAYRIFREQDADYAAKCLEASKRAYAWALKNPQIEFVNPLDISTGQYGDTNFDDEWFWADAELFITTKNPSYLDHLNTDSIDFTFKPAESWTGYMRFLGMFSLLENREVVPPDLYQRLRSGIMGSANVLVEKAKKLDYFQPIDDFHWGSNSDVLNAAMIMAQAYRLEKKEEYLVGVQQAMDYVLGHNAMGLSYLTGFGDKTPMFIHHRQSAADGIPEPVPGLLSGGPNSRLQDTVGGAVYPKNPAPMKSWVDQEPSYASNEICLNWNAPMTYVLGFLEQESK
ncbi:glycoside hydrolase family 9 protein [Ulvibacterium sp.]|uniref:glycoside hydrolase family 9 protein n=1 Tax=Ulvibacterium sp. TaxID=2665914 RepID=UPI0026106130|nr:glycoside hydrolase family 9 protein [Ulvibacterium sp.]